MKNIALCIWRHKKNVRNVREGVCASYFVRFLGISELLYIKVSVCVFGHNYMATFTESSKTDKYRAG